MMPSFLSGPLSSLQMRLALGFVFALTLALVLIGLATGFVADQQTNRFQRDRDSAQVARVRQFISDYNARGPDRRGGSPNLQEFLQRAGHISGVQIKVFDQSGTLIADSHADLPPALIAREDKSWIKRKDDIRKIPLFQDGEQIGAFTVFDSGDSIPSPEGPIQANPVAGRISGEVKRSLLWAGIGAAGLGTLLVWLLSRRTLAPLQTLGGVARRLGSGDLSQRAETTGPAEIRELARSFNVMAEGLEEAERHRRNLTADIAHELRSPLSNIQGYLEAIRDGLVLPTPETIDTIHAQAIHLSRLVGDLRLLAQVESGELQLELSTVRIEELLQSCLDAVRPRAGAKNISLDLDIDPAPPAVEIDGARISQVVGNLLDNAIIHTPQGGTVTLTGTVSVEMATISVADTGPGIAPSDLPRVFDRFYRADPSRSRTTGGSGLGLTIARRLTEAHGGTIEAESALGEGSRFTVRLPTAYHSLP